MKKTLSILIMLVLLVGCGEKNTTSLKNELDVDIILAGKETPTLLFFFTGNG